MAVISLNDVTKRFDAVTALDGLDLSVEKGEFFGFIGPNGAGKTTTINVLTGQLVPTTGTASVLGTNPVENPVKVREEVGVLPEREDPPSFLTPREYFAFVSTIRNLEREAVGERVEEWAERLNFVDKLDTISMDLSKGEKQKVMLTQAFLHEPELVFIDEPMINLDPIIQHQVTTFLEDYHADGNTVFLSTHVMSVAEELCTRVGILNQGALIKEMDIGDLGYETLTEAFVQEVERSDAAPGDD